MDIQHALSTNQLSADDVVCLDRGQGTRVIVHLHGATVLSWVCQGKEQLFVSSKSNFDNKKPVRGGIPVVFPNFGPWSLGPLHGFARVKRWTVVKPVTKEDKGDVVASFQLEEDEDTRQMWNNRFQMVYTLTLTDTSLTSRMTIRNTGTNSFDFTFALHTYFRVPDIRTTRVLGLKGLQYVDKTKDSQEFTEDREAVTIDGNCARVYRGSPATVTIQADHAAGLQLTTSSNLTDTVVWNPWEQNAKEIPDLNDDGWRHFVCVEAAQVSSPFVLESGEKMECSQTFTVLSQ